MTDNRREFERFETLLIVNIQPHSEPSRFFFGITKNISFEGFIFESQNFNLKPGSILEFKLKHPDKDLSLTAVGEILWEKKTKYEYLAGVKFRRMNEEIKSKISKLISTDEAIVTERDINKEDSEIIVSETIDNNVLTEQPDTQDQRLLSEAISRSVSDIESEKPASISSSSLKDSSSTEESHLTKTDGTKILNQNRKSSVHKATLLIAAMAVVASLLFFFWKSRLNIAPSELIASNDTAVEDIEYDPEINMPVLQDAPDSGLPDISQASNSLSEPEEITEIQPLPVDHEPSLNVGNDIIVPNKENIQEIQSESVEVSDQKNNTVHSEVATDNFPIYPNTSQVAQKPENPDKTAGKINLQPEENIQTEDFKRKRIIKYSAEPKKYFIQVGAWKNSVLAKKALSELKKDYSESYSFSKNNFQIIIIPDILTKSQANAMSKEIENKFDLKPLVAVMHKEEEINSKLSNTEILESEIIDRDIVSIDLKADAQQPTAEIAAEPVIEATLENKIETEIYRETNKPDYTPEIIMDPLDKDFMSYEESFDDNSNNWDLFDLEDASARIEDGFYHIENKKDESKLIILHFYQFPHDRDFIVEAFLKSASIASDHFYGFVFGAKDALDNYSFQINNNGHYSVKNNHGSSSQELTKGQINGLSADNDSLVSLKIAKLDNNIFIIISSFT
jgi:cell division septation protein DedD